MNRTMNLGDDQQSQLLAYLKILIEFGSILVQSLLILNGNFEDKYF